MNWDEELEVDVLDNPKPGMPPGYVEFALGVTIWDLAQDDGDDCAEICEIRRLLGINGGPQSLEELYGSFVDWTKWKGVAGPQMRINLGDVLLFVADDDPCTFLAVDMFNEATDQMEEVGLNVCCSSRHANDVAALLTALLNRVGHRHTFLQGNLGVTERLQIENFPRLVPSGGKIVSQHIAIYRSGAIISTSRIQP